MTDNPHAGPWAPNGSPEAADFLLVQQERERDAQIASAARKSIRRELERSGEVEKFIQAKIDERIGKVQNDE
jgi:hypothetical protein